MRKVRYCVAMSLDGFIAGPKHDYDWIPQDPDFDFNELYAQFDTALMGRKTYEVMRKSSEWMPPGMRILVFSHTLNPTEHSDVTIVAEKAEETITELRSEEGKDIWLFGGGELFRTLATAKLVDTVEVAVMPVLLGDGLPVLPPPSDRIKLKLESRKTSEATGSVSLTYTIV